MPIFHVVPITVTCADFVKTVIHMHIHLTLLYSREYYNCLQNPINSTLNTISNAYSPLFDTLSKGSMYICIYSLAHDQNRSVILFLDVCYFSHHSQQRGSRRWAGCGPPFEVVKYHLHWLTGKLHTCVHWKSSYHMV